MPQFRHQQFADRLAIDFILISIVDLLLDVCNDRNYLFVTDRSLPTRLCQTGADLLTIVWLANIVLLDDLQV